MEVEMGKYELSILSLHFFLSKFIRTSHKVEDMLFFGVESPLGFHEVQLKSPSTNLSSMFGCQNSRKERGDKTRESRGDMILYEILYVNM